MFCCKFAFVANTLFWEKSFCSKLACVNKLSFSMSAYWPLQPKSCEKKDFDIKSNLIYSDNFLLSFRNPQQFQYKEGLYVLETMFV